MFGVHPRTPEEVERGRKRLRNREGGFGEREIVEGTGGEWGWEGERFQPPHFETTRCYEYLLVSLIDCLFIFQWHISTNYVISTKS